MTGSPKGMPQASKEKLSHYRIAVRKPVHEMTCSCQDALPNVNRHKDYCTASQI